MRFTIPLALLTLLAPSICAPMPTNNDLGRSVTITSEDPDQDDTVIYPDYRRAVTVTSANPDEDDTVIYPDYRRSVTVHSEGDEDDTVIYPDY
ncbi:hypothetical protein BU26DRAFT_563834 [Trematosphaeria pertusa]|uniref:Uncharacterized protein n=1 Tax=Trematosphaeria pertusa TaxID=390896 RepID=A0A6A6IH73_9PLEO|nr:uncharacterized protein BU26DRAFT_563834 [Trematosphaeria pertusa]KAF2249944.1 hypothetical protein BU26DRAFT_563834 [Trematosphaeria pertusa]